MQKHRTFHIITATHRNLKQDALAQHILKGDSDELAETLRARKASAGVDELLYLSTCNRVLYLFTGSGDLFSFGNHEGFTTIAEITRDPALKLARSCPFPFIHYESETDKTQIGNWTVYSGDAAVKHLFQVASSLDSLVIGEREILRQLRDAFDVCRLKGLTGDNIRLLMRFTVQMAKRVFTSTQIGDRPVSVVSLAMRKAQLKPGMRVVLAGAGQTIQLVSEFLKKAGLSHVDVFNRSVHKAEILAEKLNGHAHPLTDLENWQQPFDLLITCMANRPDYIAACNMPHFRSNLPCTVVDLAVPGNIAPDVRQLPNVRFVNVDNLRELARENLEFRRRQMHEASVLIEEEAAVFRSLFIERQTEKALNTVPALMGKAKERAMQEVFRKDIEKLDPETRLLIARMMDYMEKKGISISMLEAKKAVASLLQAGKDLDEGAHSPQKETILN